MTLVHLFATIIVGTRYLVGAAFVVGLVVAITHWLVREGPLPAFGAWPRFVRSWSDPLLRPIETRIHRAGGNPQHAPWWLLGLIVVGGLVLIQVEQMLFAWILTARYAADGGATTLLAFLVDTAFSVVIFALLIRVIGSWLGAGRYNRLMRVTYTLTDWIVAPVRRMMPPTGMLDFSPMVAWLVLIMLRWIVMRALF